jgi:hypothetical protein
MSWEVEFTDEFGRWYDSMVPVADNLYDEHLQTLEQED